VGVTVLGEPTVIVSAKAVGVETPDTDAEALNAPSVQFAVKVEAVATPEALVVAAVVGPPENEPDGPLPGAVKVTTTLGTALPPLSETRAARLVANAVPADTLCPAPADAAILAGAPGVLVRENEAGVVTPDTEAVTVKDPALLLAVKVDAVATPLELVVAVVVAVPLAKVPLAPLPGAVKVTVTLATGLLEASTTSAASAVP